MKLPIWVPYFLKEIFFTSDHFAKYGRGFKLPIKPGIVTTLVFILIKAYYKFGQVGIEQNYLIIYNGNEKAYKIRIHHNKSAK